MSYASEYRTDRQPGMRRMRLSEWARAEGIARITAYRMLQRGILPVATERSPTGRWYVLVPEQRRSGRIVLYARVPPGIDSAHHLNEQLFVLVEWAHANHHRIYSTITEIADLYASTLPRLAQVLADRRISEIVIENPTVVGASNYNLLSAALAPQGRAMLLVNQQAHESNLARSDARTAIVNLCKTLYGPKKGMAAAHRTLEFERGA